VVELGGEAAHQFFHRREVDHEPAVGLETAFDDQAGSIVMPVQLLAAMAGECNEVRGREDESSFVMATLNSPRSP